MIRAYPAFNAFAQINTGGYAFKRVFHLEPADLALLEVDDDGTAYDSFVLAEQAVLVNCSVSTTILRLNSRSADPDILRLPGFPS